MQIKITNKIEQKVNEYQERTGATKTWIAKRMNITRQALNILFRTNNPTIESLVKVAYIIQCDIIDLFDVEIISE